MLVGFDYIVLFVGFVYKGRWEGHLAPILPISGVGGHLSKLDQNMPLLKQRVAFLDIARICELFV